MNMNRHVILNCVIIVGITCFLFLSFNSARTRARWAKLAILSCGLVGLARGIVGLVLAVGWLAPGERTTDMLHATLSLASGFLIGLIFSLVLSGQLLGRRHAGSAKRDT